MWRCVESGAVRSVELCRGWSCEMCEVCGGCEDVWRYVEGGVVRCVRCVEVCRGCEVCGGMWRV